MCLIHFNLNQITILSFEPPFSMQFFFLKGISQQNNIIGVLISVWFICYVQFFLLGLLTMRLVSLKPAFLLHFVHQPPPPFSLSFPGFSFSNEFFFHFYQVIARILPYSIYPFNKNGSVENLSFGNLDRWVLCPGCSRLFVCSRNICHLLDSLAELAMGTMFWSCVKLWNTGWPRKCRGAGLFYCSCTSIRYFSWRTACKKRRLSSA